MLIDIQSSFNIENFNILALKSIFLGYLIFRVAQRQPAARLAALYVRNDFAQSYLTR